LKVFFYNKAWARNIIEKTGAQALTCPPKTDPEIKLEL